MIEHIRNKYFGKTPLKNNYRAWKSTKYKLTTYNKT